MVDLFKNIKHEIEDTLSKVDIILIIVAISICTATMHYADIVVTSQFGIVMWDSLFDGKLLSFYQNCLNTGIAPEGAVYDIGMYIIFAIWGFPVWILQKIFHFSALAVGVQLWFKLLVFFFYLLCCIPLSQIAKKICIDEKVVPELLTMYLLTPLAWMPVLVAAQYDILPLFFVLFAIEYLFDDNKKMFIACFAFACIMKPFAMFMFLAVLLYLEKNIIIILRDFTLGVIPFCLVKLVYLLTPGYAQSSGAFMGNGLEGLFGTNIEVGLTGITFFFLGLAAIYIFAYVKETVWDKTNQVIEVIWISASVWMCFILFGHAGCYQAVYLSPFIVLLLYATCGNNENFNRLFVLELLFEIGLALVYVFDFSWVYGGKTTFKYLLLSGLWKRLNQKGDSATIRGILDKLLPMEMLLPAVGTVVVVAGIAILIFTYCSFQKSRIKSDYVSVLKKDRCGSGYKDKLVINIWQIRSRYILILIWFIICFAAMIMGGLFR